MEPIRVLLVDDKRENLLALQAALGSSEYIFDTALSGEEALKRVLTAEYGLILLDVQMPGIDGFETAQLIRKREKSRDIPILFLTAISKTAEHIARGYAVGAIDYVFKPIHLATLQAKVKVLADMHRQKLRLNRQNELLEKMVNERTAELVMANQEIRRSQQQMISILDSITDSFFTVDKEWRFTYVNKEAQCRFKRNSEELLGQSVCELWGQEEVVMTELERAMNEQIVVRFEAAIPAMQAYCAISAYPTAEGMSVYFQDVTEKKSLEREMFRLERLHLVGEMAAGIAHEIRNPMTTVRGFLQFFRRKFSGCEEQIDLMVAELDRANSIITEFLALAKNKVSHLSECDISQAIASLFPLIQAEAFVSGKNVQLSLEDALLIQANQGEIRQLILNFAKNGLEAMKPGGLLSVSAYREQAAVVLAISDQGSGIPQEIIDKVGTPFFTTKENGTGLGLAVCYSIAARHKAVIHIETNKPGTTFFVTFPAF